MADDFGLGFDDGFGLGGGLSLGPRKRKRKIDAFTPEDESTILGTLGDTAISGLAAVGNLLDLPGSSVRDVIAGQNPFDQWNPFDGSMISDKNRVTGRDLLRQGGFIGSEDTYGNWWGGVGAEILLDPTTYLSGGLSALGKGGKAFKAVGVLDDAAKVGLKAGRKVGPRLARMTTSVKQGYDLLDDAGRTLVDDYFKKNNLDLASLADEPIQSLGRMEIPFTDIGFNFGTGWGSQKIASGLDYLGDAAKASAVGRFGRMLFDPSAGGKFGKAEQEVAEEAYKAKWKGERAVKARHIELINGMDEVYKSFAETMGPEIAARNQASWDTFKTKLATEGSLTPEKAEAVSAIIKGYAEGYMKMDPGEWAEKFIQDVQKGGTIDPKALKQGLGEGPPRGWTDAMSDEFDRLEQRVEEGIASPAEQEQLEALRQAYAGKRSTNDLHWRETGKDSFTALSLDGTREIGYIKKVPSVWIDKPDENMWEVGTMIGGGVYKTKTYPYLGDAKRALRSEAIGSKEIVSLPVKRGGVTQFIAGDRSFGGDFLTLGSKEQADRVADSMLDRRMPTIDGQPPNQWDATNTLAELQQRYDSAVFDEETGQVISRTDMEQIENAQQKLASLGYKPDRQIVQQVMSNGLDPEVAARFLQRSDDEWRDIIASRGRPSRAIQNVFRSEFRSIQQLDFTKFDEGMQEALDVNLNLHPQIISDTIDEILKIKKEATAIGLEAVDDQLYELAKRVESAIDFDPNEIDDALTVHLAAKITDARTEQVRRLVKKTPGLSPAGVVKQLKELGDRVDETRAAEMLAKARAINQAQEIIKKIPGISPKGLSVQLKGAISEEDAAKLLPEAKAADTLYQHAEDPLLARTREVIAKIPGISPKGLAAQLGTVTEEQAADLLSRSKPGRKISNQADLMMKLQNGEITVEEFMKQQKAGSRLYQTDGAIKGATTFAKDGKALLQFFGAADVSTHLHEMSHVMRRHLTDADNAIANKFVGALDGKKWTVDQEEKFARGFEKYITTGQAPKGIKGLFDRLKEWMVGIYKSITGSAIDVKLTPEIQELYGRLIGTAPAPKASMPFEMFDKLVRLSAEMGDDVEGAWKVLSNGAQNLSPDVSAKVKDLGKQIKDWNKQVHESIASKGGKTGTIMERLADAGVTEGFAHMPRFADAPKPKDWTELGASKVLKTSHAGMLKRSAAIRAVPAEIVNTMLTDDAIRQAPDATEIVNRFGNYLDPNYEVDGKIVGKQGHAEALKEFVTQHRASPLFTHATAEDFLKYQMGAQAVDRNLDAIHEIVRRNSVTAAEAAGGGYVPVSQAFKNAGLADEAAVEHWSKLTGHGYEAADNGFFVPIEVANAIASVNKVYEQPEWAKAIGEAIDSFHSWWKTAMTVPFPSFHSRNFSSGQYMNIATGYVNTPADIAGYGGEVMNSLKMLRNGVPRELEEELYVYGVRGSHTRAADLAPETMGGGLPVQAQNPLQFFDKTLPSGETALGTFSTAKKAVDEAPSYFDAIPGGKSMRTGAAYITETGSKVADNVEFMNRVPMYLYLTRRKGWSPAEAAAKVNELQVNYSDLAGFEKTVMRRLVPFYAFQRRIAPVLFQTILERPGGTMAQTIKASADLNNADPLTPEHVASTLAAPNPFKSEGFEGSSYITGFGLPHEQFLQYAGGPQAMLREAISNTSPLVKAPLEWAAGQSFFQSGPGGKGRDLEDLDPTLGRTLGNFTGGGKVSTPTALEFFLANSPASRGLGTVRQLTDTRKNTTEKAINLLTGAKVTHVSPQNQERLIQQRAMDLMKSMGARTFEKPYFPDELEEEMTPEEASQAEALELLQAVLADRQKKRKSAKK